MMKEYKGFFIERIDRKVVVYNKNGQVIRTLKTIKEAKERIDNQTI